MIFNEYFFFANYAHYYLYIYIDKMSNYIILKSVYKKIVKHIKFLLYMHILKNKLNTFLEVCKPFFKSLSIRKVSRFFENYK